MEETYGGAVAANIRAEMARHRITQEQLARAAGIDRVGLTNRLNGKARISVDELGAIAVVLGVDPAALLPALNGKTTTTEPTQEAGHSS